MLESSIRSDAIARADRRRGQTCSSSMNEQLSADEPGNAAIRRGALSSGIAMSIAS
jgi:hypothetical protein